MQNGAVMLRKIPEAAEALHLSPGCAIGMTIGPQVVQLQPAAIATAVMGTKVHRSIYGTRAAGRGGHRPLERLGPGGTLGLGLGGGGGRGWRGRASPGPAERQHEAEPYERQQS